MIKAILIIFGTVSLCLGIIGIFIPGLPTTPFILLTAGLYLRSSEKLYKQLTGTRYLGHYISDFQKYKGMDKQLKVYSILIMWVMILISVYFFINKSEIKLLLISIGLIGSIVMGLVIKTVNKK